MSVPNSMIVASPGFEAHWPFVVDELARCLARHGTTEVVRTPPNSTAPLGEIVALPGPVTRLVCLDIPVDDKCLDGFENLREAVFLCAYGGTYLSVDQQDALRARGVRLIEHTSEGFWGQSVAEFALGLTLGALRQIPQNYHALCVNDGEAWARYQPERNQGPGMLGAQYSDDSRFTNGTLAGKRVRVVGAGNIGSRFAHFAHALGADVAMWDPVAPEPAFHRSGARRVWHLSELVEDAQIFAPMMPLLPATREIVPAEQIRRLPDGCLVVLVTRAGIVDMRALRTRVLADELALAADVFDVEPLPAEDPLLRRANVVHTPHLAGRTRDANFQWVGDLVRQFAPVNAAGNSA